MGILCACNQSIVSLEHPPTHGGVVFLSLSLKAEKHIDSLSHTHTHIYSLTYSRTLTDSLIYIYKYTHEFTLTQYLYTY